LRAGFFIYRSREFAGRIAERNLQQKALGIFEFVKRVQDNLNPHSAGAFYETFDPKTAHTLKKLFAAP
jgi:hypothetical protein